jgi:predicted phage terminase large subunit-like protein
VSWDTAFKKTERSDYSACTTWGIFYNDENGKPVPNIILLDAFKEKMEFPELKRTALEHYKQWQPDMVIIEAKASGSPLIFELRAAGIPVTDFTPSRGQDKIARVNAITDLFASGAVWCPDTRWAEEVIEECAAFPAGAHDDFVDSVSQAMLRFRQGGFVKIYTDEEDEEYYRPPNSEPYY